MSRWMMAIGVCLIAIWANGGSTIAAQRGEPGTIRLQRAMSFQLDVERLNAEVDCVLMTQWTYGDQFPTELLARLKKSSQLRKSTHEPFLNSQGNVEKDSGYIRWSAEDRAPSRARALVWYVNGDQRKELVVSVGLGLDHTLGQSQPIQHLAFDAVRVAVDLRKGKITEVRWGESDVTGQSDKAESVETVHDLQVSFTGSLTGKSSESIRMADHLLNDEITRTLGDLAQVPFRNDSHSGISLLWINHDQLQHRLLVSAHDRKSPVLFRYSVSGSPFPLSLVRRQLAVDAWPIVLHGTKYVGRSQDGLHIYRPVDVTLSRQPRQPSQP